MDNLFLLLFLLSLLALFIGIIKPNLVIRWGETEKRNRKNVLKIYGLVLIVSLILFGVSLPPSDSKDLVDASTDKDNAVKEEEKKEKEKIKVENEDVVNEFNVDTIEDEPEDFDIYINPNFNMEWNTVNFDMDTNLVDNSILEVTIIGQNLESITKFFTVENGKVYVVFDDISKLGLGWLDLEVVLTFDGINKEQPDSVKNIYGEDGNKLAGKLVNKDLTDDGGKYIYYYRSKFKRIK